MSRRYSQLPSTSAAISMAAGQPPGEPLPSGAPVLRRSLCSLAQPVLKQARQMPRFLFHEATVLFVMAGRLDLDDGVNRLSVGAQEALLLIDPESCLDVRKAPESPELPFRSVFLSFPAALLETFHRHHAASKPSGSGNPWACRQVPLDTDLAETLRGVMDGVQASRVSDERLAHRLMDFLLALAERGHAFADAGQRGTAGRLRALLGEAPDRHWTARAAGQALAMSEATLRRRLASENVRFEALLVDIRMHHAMMLLQTTPWSIPRIAQACGYQSRARFADRFRLRFGYLPSAVR